MARSTTSGRRPFRLALVVTAAAVAGPWLAGARPVAAEALPMPEQVKFVLHLDLDRLRGSELYDLAAEQVAVFARSDEK